MSVVRTAGRELVVRPVVIQVIHTVPAGARTRRGGERDSCNIAQPPTAVVVWTGVRLHPPAPGTEEVSNDLLTYADEWAFPIISMLFFNTNKK